MAPPSIASGGWHALQGRDGEKARPCSACPPVRLRGSWRSADSFHPVGSCTDRSGELDQALEQRLNLGVLDDLAQLSGLGVQALHLGQELRPACPILLELLAS